MSCPRCGGSDREPIAPGFWRCTTVLTRLDVVGMTADGSPMHRPTQFRCGNEYQEGLAAGFAGTPVCAFCTTFAIGTCASCDSPVCGTCSSVYGGRRLCRECREDVQVRRTISFLDFLHAAAAQGYPGLRTYQLEVTFKEPWVERRREGLRSKTYFREHLRTERRSMRGWPHPDPQVKIMLGLDAAEHFYPDEASGNWREPVAVLKWPWVAASGRRLELDSLEKQSDRLRGYASAYGIDLSTMEARNADQARRDWARQDEEDAAERAALHERAWSVWRQFVEEGLFDVHARDLVSYTIESHWTAPEPAAKHYVADHGVPIGYFNVTFSREDGGWYQLALTRSGRWVTMGARAVQDDAQFAERQHEVDQRLLDRLIALRSRSGS